LETQENSRDIGRLIPGDVLGLLASTACLIRDLERSACMVHGQVCTMEPRSSITLYFTCPDGSHSWCMTPHCDSPFCGDARDPVSGPLRSCEHCEAGLPCTNLPHLWPAPALSTEAPSKYTEGAPLRQNSLPVCVSRQNVGGEVRRSFSPPPIPRVSARCTISSFVSRFSANRSRCRLSSRCLGASSPPPGSILLCRAPSPPDGSAAYLHR